ncbi:hypothetical protein L596_025220 [Steinernema carpocapsae]|uniref:DBF4-type domain-containing protein n=1 Tax=Steinernema carpocapsae TaxID=34508 RepID=A0A4U5M751_STECR|nr:hypothetical protein L596_025220 [Steinernema carpocapsae]
MDVNAGCTSNSLSLANRRSNAPAIKRRLPSSIKTGTVEKKARLDPQTTYKGSSGSRGPWEAKNFKIDVNNKTNETSIKKDIQKLGGRIIDEFSSTATKPHFLITDDPLAGRCEKGNVTAEIRKRLGGVLREALDQKINIKSAKGFLENIEDYKKKFQHLFASPSTSKAPEKKRPDQLKVHKLKESFMKIQDCEMKYAPTYKEFVNPPFKLFVGSAAGKSAFHEVTPEELERRAMKKSPRKPVKRPEFRKGQCEICNVACQNLQEHYLTMEHIKRVRQPDFYCEVDALCGSFVDEVKVTGCRTLPPRQRSPERKSPPPSGSLSGFMKKYYSRDVESD